MAPDGNYEAGEMEYGNEDDLIRLLCEKLERHRLINESKARIQEVDGGFFEKFGSLFRERAESAENRELVEKKQVAELAAEVISSGHAIQSGEPGIEPKLDGTDTDGLLALSSDSEAEDEKQNDFVPVGWNVDELYSEILYEILHNVGCDVSNDIGQTALFSYIQEAFRFTSEQHAELLEIAEKKEPPSILLNVEVIEAKDLKPKDSNGLSDPFVTLYLSSNASHRYNTSVKTGTLAPAWEEHFALPVGDNINNDTLCLEVWDFDPAESVKEKVGKIFDVKGVKGMRKLMKEIAVTAATGQHDNELIGKASVPLKLIPASGMVMWYSLEKKHKITRQGVIKVRISFSSEKNSQVAEQEHRHLLRIILLHELENSKVSPYCWNGTFTAQGEAVLTQHTAQSGLNATEVAICRWTTFSGIHQNHPLSFSIFSKYLDVLCKPIQTAALNEIDTKLFWESAKKILPSCFNIVRKIRRKSTKEKVMVQQLREVLHLLSKLTELEPPPNTDLFPIAQYPWTHRHDDTPNCDVMKTLDEAVIQGAMDWFNHLMENNVRNHESEEGKIRFLIQIIQLVRTDLQKAVEFHDKIFQETVNYKYAQSLYTFYQAKIATSAEPEVRTLCSSLKKLSFTGYTVNHTDSSEILSEGTSLFELYLALQRFVLLGDGICPGECDTFHIKNFHKWFHGGIAQWLDIAVYKALQRIEKAVELDNLTPVDSTVKYSSSAVDTLSIFYQVKIFWQQLNWPDVEGSYTFIAKIIDDICRCCVFYANIMSKRVEGLGESKDIYEKRFEVTNEWCLAINNIDYVRQALRPFTEELHLDSVIQKLSDLTSPLDAERCQITLDNVILNAIDTVKNEIIGLMEIVISKMAPAMKRLLIEGAELFSQDSNSIDRLMMYVDNNLSTLHRELNEENFDRVLAIVWDELNKILKDIIQSNLDKRRPPSFYANLHKTLNLMMGSFKSPEDTLNCDDLRQTERILKLNGLETADLIHQVHKDLYSEFNELKESRYGEISVRVKFEGTTLKVELINGRNLIAMDSNGSSDSFIRVHLLPEHKFANIPKPKTQTHNKNLFPLYDVVFDINLSAEQLKVEDAMLLFSCKDRDLLGYNNQYIGEAFLRFSDIPDTTEPLQSLPQIQLQLGRPKDMNSDALKALDHRTGDKQAKEFLKKYKQRISG